jgi:hypothetical protein
VGGSVRASSFPSVSAVMASSSTLGSLSDIFNCVAFWFYLEEGMQESDWVINKLDVS